MYMYVYLHAAGLTAHRLQNLNADESLVYNVIHSTGRSGIWVRAIQKRTNLHKLILDRCLKSLEGKNYIKSVHNVKQPTHKVYMLAGLAPSEDVTGGAWFTDGVLDANFINSVAQYIEYTVSRKSWYEAAPGPATHRSKRLKTANGTVSVPAASGAAAAAAAEPADKVYYPFPAGYKGYPTLATITAAVNESGITPVRLGEEKISQLLEMLCYDGKLVQLNGDEELYKSVRNVSAVKEEQALKQAAVDEAAARRRLVKNGMTEAPCGQCPVFNLCAPGASVSPETCEYFDPWLETALGF